MAGWATEKFRDEFCFPALGIPPQILNTGSIAGTAIQIAAAQATSAGPAGNYAAFKKWAFILQTGSGSTQTTWNAWIAAGSGSAGSASVVLPASSTSTFSASQTYVAAASAQYGSNAVIVMEVRNEYVQGLGSGFTWIRPVISVTGASALGALLSLGFGAGSVPASLYDTNGGFCLQETDAF